jgi:hypothetical protein
MRQREDTDRQSSHLEAARGNRKPYQKPAVRYEKVFETSALKCGKVQSTQSGCRFNRRTS